MKGSAVGTVLRDRFLRRTVVAFGAFASAEAAMWLACLVYAYERGGVVEAGIAGGLLLVPAALLAPLAAPVGDRFRRDRVLAAGYAAQAACMALSGAAVAWGAPGFVVYLTFSAVCVAVAFTRPAIGAILPCVAREPEHLSISNAAIGALENVGGLLGPLVAAGLLLAGGVAGVFFATAAVMAAAFLAVATLGIDPRLARPSSQALPLRDSIAGGLDFLRRDLDLLLLLTCVAAPSLLLGAIEVLVVAVSIEQLGRGAHFAGVLNAVFGFGGLLGAAAAGLMTGRRGLVLVLCLAGLLAGLPIAALAATAVAAAAFGCLFASGAGHSLGHVVGNTLIQRASPDRFRATVFGVLEGLETASLALGALLVASLSGWLGLSGTLLVVGAFVPALLLLSLPRLLAIDAGASAPGARVLSALRRNPIFAPLAPPTIERIASRATVVEARPGQVIVREGEIGDRYYCVLEGDLEIHIAGRLVRTLSRGDSFGEIALLYAVPRTATVSARSASTLVAVEGVEFLETVSRHRQSLIEADRSARQLLDAAGPRG